MGKIIYISIILLAGASLFFTCEPPKAVPIIPEVNFKSVEISDARDTLGNEIKLVKLTIELTDGDGDIGIKYENGDTYPGFEDLGNANLFITLFEKINGGFVEVDLKAPHNYATPFLEPDGQDKTLRADLEVSIQYSDTLFVYDTIMYSFYVYDRAMNISNTAETPEIPADSLGLIE